MGCVLSVGKHQSFCLKEKWVKRVTSFSCVDLRLQHHFLQPQKKEIHFLIRAAAVYTSKSGSGGSALPCCRRRQQQYGLSGGADVSVKRSQQSNVCLQISALPGGKIILWGPLVYTP